MRSIIAILFGIAVTIAAAYVHDTAFASPTDKPLVNWDQFGGITRSAVDAVRNEWYRLTK
jgi:hypothetical protein